MHKLRAIAIAVALGAMAFPALAQETTVIGRSSNKPSVVVDLSVLDELGPVPTVPQVLLQKPPVAAAQPGERAPSRLKAPGANGSAKSKKSSAAKPGKKPQTKTAAEPSTPSQPQIASVAPALPPVAAVPMPPPLVTEAQPSAPAPPPLPSLAPSTLAPLAAAPVLPPAATPNPAPRAAAPAAPVPAASAPQQLAALPPPGASVGAGKPTQLTFGESASQLDDKARRDLDVLVRTIGSDEETRLQLTAYASAPGADNASQARRLSLSRALAVRTYLIEKGVKSTRIDVRALGNKNEGGPADRVDVVVARR